MSINLILKAILLYVLVNLSCPVASQTITQQINSKHDGAEMEQIYHTINLHTHPRQELDQIRSTIAMQYAFENRLDKAIIFIDYIDDAPLRANKYFSLARTQKKLQDHQGAIQYGRKSFNIALANVNQAYPDHDLALQPKAILSYSTILLVELLSEDQSYREALSYIDQALEHIEKSNSVQLQLLKADILEKEQHYESALQQYSSIFMQGRQSEDIRQKLKELYKKSHCADTSGFEKYLSDLQQNKRSQFLEHIRDMRDLVKAPNFTLKNMDGNPVSLQDYKGKVVVIDFWATWCGPCKASFPAMQQAVDRYRDDPDVVFLFINTWERSPNSEQEADKYIKAHSYSFNVLFDTSTTDNSYEVVGKYQVKGLPEKIFIDKNGNIRYRLTGFNGDSENTVQEIVDIIDLIAAPPLNQS